jgi:hypothetical protein
MTAQPPDLRFSERMRGWVSFDARDYNTGVIAGRRDGTRCSLKLAVEVDDLDGFLGHPDRAARIRGTVACPQLGGTLEVERGDFNLFVLAPDARRRRVLYRLFVRDAHERPLTVSGFKLLEDDPNHDVWRDTSRLLVRILAGHVSRDFEEVDDPRVVATGVLRITPLGFVRSVLTMRGGPGRRLRGPLRYQREFARQLLAIYGGRALPATQFAFPAVKAGATQFQGQRPGEWRELAGHSGLERRILAFPADDDREINLHHIRGQDKPTRGQVLLIGGLAMRANSFYDAPVRPTLVDALVDHSYDVWIENWRTSIDLPAGDYTLDSAAVYDHPAAIRKIREETGCEKLDAIAHCMGSASLTMSVLAELAPELRTVVSSAVSLHIDLDPRSRLRLWTLLPMTSVLLRMRGADPQWAARAPSVAAAGFAGVARLSTPDYSNPLNAAATYIYGGRPEGMWQLDNVDADTLEWLAREFGYAPFSFFRQIRRCATVGHLVPVEGLDELDRDFGKLAPPNGTRFVFLCGARNQFFLPAGQRRTYEHFDERQRGRHDFFELKGYSHLDVLIGRRWHRDVFPLIRDALDAGADGGS